MTDFPGRPPEGDWLGTPYLRFERSGPFAVCTIDRPDRKNAMTAAMYFGVRVAIRRVEQDPDLAGLLITGTGDIFCPGGDLSQTSDDRWMDLEGLLYMDNTPFDAVRTATKPIVSAVNGLCQGGGLVIAMLSDVAVVSEQATFRVPELYRGIADTQYANILPKHIGIARARDLMMTGRELSAAEAADWGLVTRVVAPDRVLDEGRDALAACCRTAPKARLDIKAAFDAEYGLYDRVGMTASLVGDEPFEGFEAFKERRSPSWVHPDLRNDDRL
ncbi:MAG: enoyl-CoA hydratase/isomerase family protein [Acidimicrobiales bacterium]|nr:enoyl-CoA hydratase/isomerase family protein [Acidimicrobiales bacterium]